MKHYAVVIDSIEKSYQGVQLGHVTGVTASQNPKIDWSLQTFVYLKASIKKFNKLIDVLTNEGIKFNIFHEPDIDMITSIGCVTDRYDLFKNFELF